MRPELLYFIGAFIISAFVHFILIRVSHKRGLFIDDHESDLPQKLHDTPTPRIGGLGIFLACVLFALQNHTGALLLGCSIPAFLSGLFEDLFANITPKKRLMIMVVSASLGIYFCQAVVTDFGAFQTPYWVGIVISFIAILGLINGTNLIDGFNGLLSCTSILIFSSFAYIAYLVGDTNLFFINLIIVAALLGFLVFNYPGGHIFMGDGGAYYLGFIMAVIAMLLPKNNPNINPFFVLLIIIYPVTEVIFSFVRRGVINRTNPLEPDDKHLHTYINKQLAGGKNSKTIFYILPLIVPFQLIAVYFYNNQTVLICSSIAFAAIYTFYYIWLDRKSKAE